MIEGLQHIKEKLSPLKDLEGNDIFRFGEYAAVKDVSMFSYDFNSTDFHGYKYKIIAHRLTSEDKTITRKYYRRIYKFYWNVIPDKILSLVTRNKKEILDRNFSSKKLILPEMKCEKSDVFYYENEENGTIYFYIFGTEII